MQKKILLILGTYIVVLLLLGIGLGCYQKVKKIPLLEQAILEDIISKIAAEESGKQDGSAGGSEKATTSGESGKIIFGENDYWSKYRNEEGGFAKLAAQIKSEISAGDKARVIYILQKNLDDNDISYILSLVNDGVSATDKSELKALLQRKISEQDQMELKSLALKYFNKQ